VPLDPTNLFEALAFLLGPALFAPIAALISGGDDDGKDGGDSFETAPPPDKYSPTRTAQSLGGSPIGRSSNDGRGETAGKSYFEVIRAAVCSAMSVFAYRSGRDFEYNSLYSDNPSATIEGVRVSIEVPADAGRVSNRKMEMFLSIVIAELVDNAMKYRDPAKIGNQFVRIYLRSGNIVVEDNGVGIKNVFGVFRGYRERPDLAQGRGFGLNHVSRYIGRMPGWSIDVESALGKYTRFIITSGTEEAVVEPAIPPELLLPPQSIRPANMSSLPVRLLDLTGDLTNYAYGLRNPRLKNPYFYSVVTQQDELPLISRLPLTDAVFRRVLSYVLDFSGKQADQVLVIIPGFAGNLFELTNWLSLGTRVVAIETARNIDTLMVEAEFDKGVLGEAYRQGRLVLKKIGEEAPKGDIVVWTFPGPADTAYEDLVDPLSGGGVIIVQSEEEYYSDQLRDDRSMQMIVELGPLGPEHYILPSPFHVILANSQDVRVAIYQKTGAGVIPPDVNGAPQAGGGGEITEAGGGEITSADAEEITAASDSLYEEFVPDEYDDYGYDADSMITGAFAAAGVPDFAAFAGI